MAKSRDTTLSLSKADAEELKNCLVNSSVNNEFKHLLSRCINNLWYKRSRVYISITSLDKEQLMATLTDTNNEVLIAIYFELNNMRFCDATI